jgi:hypothetical protein
VGDDAGVARDASTLAEIVDGFGRDGFTGSFRSDPGARVACLTCRAVVEGSTLRPASMRRLEGASDPADMLAVAALVCPVCAARGTLVLGYGPDASPEDSDVLSALLATRPSAR